jgi:C4-dicarboxylate-specific signal transduction histidine kinase
VLTLAKMELAPDRGTTELWKVLANRGLALFAIGMTTLLGVLRRRAEAERRKAEERVREQQATLAHLGRLSMLGQVAAGLAHELNQPLAAACLQADIASRLAAGDSVRPELTTALTEIADQTRRAADIVKSIRRMASRSAPRHDPVDVNDVARGVARLVDWQAQRAGVAVRLKLAEPLEPTFGDRTQFEQVLFNLMQNAIEAVTGRDGPRVVAVETAAAADAVTVSVRDTGPGLADAARAFEPFYTTKPDGLGLGLAISRGIVEAHGGTLQAGESADGGAEFVFTLPTAAKE